MESGKGNVVDILKKVRNDRIRITHVTKEKFSELGEKLSKMSEEVTNELGNKKDDWLARLQILKEDAKELLVSNVHEELKDINQRINKFLETTITNGKNELIELMDEFKKILNDKELKQSNDELKEALDLNNVKGHIPKDNHENVVESNNDKDFEPIKVENEQHGVPNDHEEDVKKKDS